VVVKIRFFACFRERGSGRACQGREMKVEDKRKIRKEEIIGKWKKTIDEELKYW
jgi:hypothetical protein